MVAYQIVGATKKLPRHFHYIASMRKKAFFVLREEFSPILIVLAFLSPNKQHHEKSPTVEKSSKSHKR